ncbi:MAG TPA: efflux RND transporter periplasmic adaptor subunit [Rhizobiales bacterium]|nr:efflux RND transporter periplasmic adaptor subunit [Hyphomicrobiales bacterium]
MNHNVNIDRTAPATAASERPGAAPRRSRWRVFFMAIMPIVMLGAGILGFWGLMATKSAVKPHSAPERAWVVQTKPVSFTTSQPDLQLYGEIVAARKVDLRTLAAGEIVEVGKDFKEGASVSAGEELIRIDRFDYLAARDEARARLSEARARRLEILAKAHLEESALKWAREQLEIARSDYERAVKLKGIRAVAQNVVDTRKLALSQRAQAVQLRRDNLQIQKARAEQQDAVIKRLELGVRRAIRNLENTVLKAPFDGYLAKINAEKGRFVGVNDAIATLIARDSIDVRFTLSDRQYGRILAAEGTVLGRRIKVLWRVGGKPLEYDGVIDRVGAQISASTGGVYVYAHITGGKDQLRALRPGAFVEVSMKDRSFDRVIALPESALYGSGTLYVVDDRRLVSRKVSVVGNSGPAVLVRGNLKKGEHVLITRLAQAGDGLLVDVQTKAATTGRKSP